MSSESNGGTQSLLGELTEQEQQTLVELAKKHTDSGLTRREAIAASGAVLSGAAIGGGGAAAMTGNAAAAASTSDGDGDIGSPSNRVDVFAQAVDTDEVNNAHWVAPGESIQSVLDSLATPTGAQAVLERNIVYLTPHTEYNEKVVIPNYASLCLNGAYVQPATDGHAVELGGPGAELWGPGRILTGQGYAFTKAALYLNSANWATHLNAANNNTVHVGGNVELHDPGNESKLVHIVSDGNGVSIGNRFDVELKGGAEQVVFETNNGGWVNGLDMPIMSWPRGSTVSIVHRNTVGAAGAGRAFVHGEIQAGDVSDYVIRNETSQTPSIHFSGQIYDPANSAIAAVDGPGIRCHQTRLAAAHVNFGAGTTINGFGVESANAETPTAANYHTGDEVDFTDSGDGSGNGVYVLLPDGTWSKIGT